MAKNKNRDMIIMGFALFAIFFGAGNLIFPPYLGVISGTDWSAGMFGFLTTDPLLPVLGVVATVLAGGSADDLGKRVSSGFAKLIGTLAMLIIGPFFAVPRTASVTHDIAVKSILPDFPAWGTSVIFFGIVFVLIFNQSKVIDIIGKYLTPVLIVVLAILIIKGIVSPIGDFHMPLVDQIGSAGTYFKGFTEGYQTMDALGAGLMAGIVITDMKRRGYDNEGERKKLSFGVAAVSLILLALVYGGLTYVGATYSDKVLAGVDLANPDALNAALDRATLLKGVTAEILGAPGAWLLAICVLFACMTTATGLTSTAGNFFSSNIFKDKVSYKVIVTICVIISLFVSILGTGQIIKIAVPVLFLIYPTFVVLIFLTLIGKYIKYDSVFVGAVALTIPISVVSALEVLGAFGIQLSWLAPISEAVAKLPFGTDGFPWVVPALVGAVCGLVFGVVTKGKKQAA